MEDYPFFAFDMFVDTHRILRRANSVTATEFEGYATSLLAL